MLPGTALSPLAELQLSDGAILLPPSAWSSEQLLPLLAEVGTSQSVGDELPQPIDLTEGKQPSRAYCSVFWSAKQFATEHSSHVVPRICQPV